MSIQQEVCPSCAAPVSVPANATRFKCPYCAASLTVARKNGEIDLELVSTIAATATVTQEAIQEGTTVTQSELRRLQLTQELSQLQTRLSNTQSELRAIERMPPTPVSKRQMADLRRDEAALMQQIKVVQDTLYPPAPTSASRAQTVSASTSTSPGTLRRWLALFFSFSGRISRRYFWLTMLVSLIGGSILITPFMSNSTPESASPIMLLWSLVALWIYLAVATKRYRDLGKSPLWIAVALIPVVGWIWQVIELGFRPGKHDAGAFAGA